MKKLLLVFTVAAFLTACGGNTTSTETTVAPSDSAMMSTPAPSDSAMMAAPAIDTTKMANADSAK